MFVWKVYRGIFFSCERIGSRVFNVNMQCRIYGALEYINVYSIFECYIAEQIWGAVTVSLSWREKLFRSLEDWVVFIGEKLTVLEVEYLLSITRNIWNVRNNFFFEKSDDYLEKVAERVIQFTDVFQKVSDKVEMKYGSREEILKPLSAGI